MKVLKKVKIIPANHRRTEATRHYINGSELITLPDILQIASFEGDPGYYLLHIDSDGNELTDTYHESIDDAFEQAKLEFLVEVGEWSDF